MSSIRFNVIKDFGGVDEYTDAPRFRLVNWNGYEKYDLRRWSEDGEQPYKGVTIGEDKIENFLEILTTAVNASKSVSALYTVKLGKATAKILNTYGSFSNSGDMSKQITYINWGGGAKYDVRPWSEDYSVCGKGITLTEAQCTRLINIIKDENGLGVKYGIAFEDFVIRSSVFHCNKNHSIEALQALISILKYNGEVITETVSSGYCRQCNCYFILESEYQRIRGLGIPLCRQITEKAYNDKGLLPFNGEELNPESLLHSVGYNVNATEDLSDEQRHDILSFVVESGLYTISGVCSHIDWLIDKNVRVKNRDMTSAISKWADDRKYISNYKIGTRPMVGVRSLKGRGVR